MLNKGKFNAKKFNSSVPIPAPLVGIPMFKVNHGLAGRGLINGGLVS